MKQHFHDLRCLFLDQLLCLLHRHTRVHIFKIHTQIEAIENFEKNTHPIEIKNIVIIGIIMTGIDITFLLTTFIVKMMANIWKFATIRVVTVIDIEIILTQVISQNQYQTVVQWIEKWVVFIVAAVTK